MRKIVSYTPAPGGKGWIVTLECGHTRHLPDVGNRVLCWDCKEHAMEPSALRGDDVGTHA